MYIFIYSDPSLPQPPHCPIGPLVAQVEKHNRLTLIRPWLEARLQEYVLKRVVWYFEEGDVVL